VRDKVGTNSVKHVVLNSFKLSRVSLLKMLLKRLNNNDRLND